MNILLDTLPEAVRVGDAVFYINTDFRAGVEFEIMVEKGEENAYNLLRPYFANVPEDIDAALTAVMWFFRCGAETEESEAKPDKRPYSFAVDSAVIFSDFWRCYQIDLTSTDLHWWVFRALLTGLPENSEFKQRCYYRTCELKGLPKNEIARINKIRKAIEIKGGPAKISLAERNNRWLDYVRKRSEEAKG